MIVRLPWPDRRLSPNARIHRMQRAKLVAAARDDALIATCGQLSVQQRREIAAGEGEIVLAITFRPPDARRRDLDNMLASAKAALDGLAYACQVDDYRFAIAMRRGSPLKGGTIEVGLWIAGIGDPLAFQAQSAPVTGLLPVEKGATQ